MIREDRAEDFSSLRKHFEQQKDGQDVIFDYVAYAMFAVTRDILLHSDDRNALYDDMESLFNKAVLGMARQVACIADENTYKQVVTLYNELSPNERGIIFAKKLPEVMQAVDPAPALLV